MMDVNEVDGLIGYIDDLSAKCRWPEADRNSVLADLRQIRNRLADPRLYLGVVGEFSAGKSTFINALLGVELLKEDVLQGTTCVPTFLGTGSAFNVEVVFKDDTVLKYSSTVSPFRRILRRLSGLFAIRRSWLEDVAAARSFICKYTAEEEVARTVERVVLTLPIKLPFLSDNVVLVDTPGVNAENARHQEVTEAAMRRYCDLVVALTVAPTPCPKSLMTFLHENETWVKDRCIGLITQIDRIRKAERSRQINFVRARFETEEIGLLGLYSAAPYYSVHPEDADTEDRKACRDEFPKVVAEILQRLEANKVTLISNKTRELLENVIHDHVIPVVDREKVAAEKNLEQLESARRMPLRDFTNEWKDYCRNQILSSRIQEGAVVRDVNSLADRFFAHVEEVLKSANSRSDVIRAYSRSLSRQYVEEHVGKPAAMVFAGWSRDEASLRDLCLSDFAAALAETYCDVLECRKWTPKCDGVRPLPTCSCDISSYASDFKFAYLKRLLLQRVSGIVLGFLALLIIAGVTDGKGVVLGLIVGLGIVVGFFLAAGNAAQWRARAMSSMASARERLVGMLSASLWASLVNTLKHDLEVIDECFSDCQKNEKLVDRKIREEEVGISSEQDKIQWAEDALPTLNRILENLKNDRSAVSADGKEACAGDE